MTERRFQQGTLPRGSKEAILYDGLDEVLQRLDAHLNGQDEVIAQIKRQIDDVHASVAWLVQREQSR